MTITQLDRALAEVVPTTSEGADFLLDLRQLLLERGHPGKCVRCFFGLLGDLRQPGALKPLRRWLEQHLEVVVSADGREVEALPVRLGRAADLEGFCHQSIDTVRHDRAIDAERITLSFRYKPATTAA